MNQLAEKYRPRTIDGFVGLDKVKRVLKKFAANPHESPWLFHGPSGVGKTSMALALAAEINAQVTHISGPKCGVNELKQLTDESAFAVFTGFKFNLWIIDEADHMPAVARIDALSAIDSAYFPRNTIVIFTANELRGFTEPFQSRCHKLEFSSYGMSKDLTTFLEKVWRAEGGPAGVDFTRLVKDSSNNVRACLMKLEVELLALQD
jgi:DNA polymerase III delta prime subunit